MRERGGCLHHVQICSGAEGWPIPGQYNSVQASIGTQLCKCIVQVFDQLCVESIARLGTAHSDGRHFVLVAVVNSDVCVCWHNLSFASDFEGRCYPSLLLFPSRTGTRPPPPLHTAPCPYNPYIRKTPNGVSGMGAFSEAAMPSARTVRVSRGSMMPSSQIRAVL